MQAKVEILVKDDSSVREHHLLIPGEYFIGRGEDCHIVVQGVGVSYRHLQLVVTASRIVVTDLNSTNGTFLENHRVEGSVQISFGDHIRLGKKKAPVLQLLRESFEMSPGAIRNPVFSRVAELPDANGDPVSAAAGETDSPAPAQPEVPASLPAVSSELPEAEYKDRVRALEEALMAAVRTREDLHRRLEREERERKLQAAAVAEEWTALLHEKEHALEGLAELRAIQEYRQQLAAQKLQQFRADLKNREGKPEDPSTSRDPRQTAVTGDPPSTLPSRSAEELVAAADIIEAQEAELAQLRRQLEEVRNRKAISTDARPLETSIALAPPQKPAPPAEGSGSTTQLADAQKQEPETPAVPSDASEAKDADVSPSTPPAARTSEPEIAKTTSEPAAEAPESPDEPSWTPEPETSRRWKWILAAAGAVVLLGGGGYFASVKFKEYQLDDLTRTAQAALDKGDFTLASLSARRALQVEPDSLRACTIMAEMSERAGDVAAVSWRQRIVEINPHSVDARLKAALTAIRFGRDEAAKAALASVPEAERNRADYLSAAGEVAAATHESAEAESCFSKALAIDPQNSRTRFLLAKLQAGSDDLFTRDAGRALLSNLAKDHEFGIEAQRALLSSFRKTGEVQAALRISGDIAENPLHTFSDVLGRLSLLAITKDRALPDELLTVQNSVTRKPIEAAVLLGWMNSTGLAAEGVEWVTHRKPEVGQLAEIQTPLTACEIAVGDWTAVLQLTEPNKSTITEYIRRAYRARALREQRRGLLSQSEWQLAVNAAGRSEDALMWLATVAETWKWKDEEEQTLWRATEKSADAVWALRRLSKRYKAEGNTDALRRVAARMLQSDPGNEDAQNDFALLSLLTFKEIERARQMARELYQKHPKNAAYASTYAFALHLGDQTPEALRVLRTLPAAQLEEPSIAAYFGTMLAANNELQEAAHYLDLAKRAHLLPPERKLVSEAAQSLPVLKGNEPRERLR